MKKADTRALNRPHRMCIDGQNSSKLVITHTYTFYDYRSGLSNNFIYLHLYYNSVAAERSSGWLSLSL